MSSSADVKINFRIVISDEVKNEHEDRADDNIDESNETSSKYVINTNNEAPMKDVKTFYHLPHSCLYIKLLCIRRIAKPTLVIFIF